MNIPLQSKIAFVTSAGLFGLYLGPLLAGEIPGPLLCLVGSAVALIVGMATASESGE